MTSLGRVFLSLAALLLFTLPAHAFDGADYLLGSDDTDRTHKLAIGMRVHDEIKAIPELPHDQGDLSWLLAYEYHSNVAYWQLALGYTPESNTDRDAEVFTPQVNLIFKESIYRLGLGALTSYVDEDGETDWTDVYWQAIAGIEISLGTHASIGLFGCYVFNKWEDITDSGDNGLAGNLLLSWAF